MNGKCARNSWYLEWIRRVDNVKDCHSEQHVGTLSFLEFEARFAPRENFETFLRGWEKDSSQAQNDRVECSG